MTEEPEIKIPTHEQVVKKVMVRTRLGMREVSQVAYKRTQETETQINDLRLGIVREIPPMEYDGIEKDLEKRSGIFIASEYQAKRMLRARLDRDKRPHKICTGNQLLAYYLSGNDTGANTTLHEGFRSFPQMFLFYGYAEPKNQYIPQLIAEVVNTRNFENLHVWLFLRQDLGVMTARYETMAQVSHLEIADLRYLDQGDEPPPGLTPRLDELDRSAPAMPEDAPDQGSGPADNTKKYGRKEDKRNFRRRK
jgi:hypothetical protein